MRKFGIQYCRLHPEREQVRNAFAAVKKPGEWRAVLDEWY
jgi:hypothetical protein